MRIGFIEDFVNSLFASGGLPVIAIGIIVVLLGALESFMGYRIYKFQVAIVVFLAALHFGIKAFTAVMNVQWFPYMLAIVFAILMGCLAFGIYKVGVFLMAGALAYAAVFSFTQHQWAAAIAAVVVGVLGVVLTKHVIIIVTAIAGGIIATSGVATLVWGAPQAAPAWLQYCIVIVLGAASAVVQYRSNRDTT